MGRMKQVALIVQNREPIKKMGNLNTLTGIFPVNINKFKFLSTSLNLKIINFHADVIMIGKSICKALSKIYEISL